MRRIEASSKDIGQIIAAIDEIAFQTNLLALNAGVEAARAGESGRGFAVVASEVRTLAQRAAESAKEIKALINNSSQEVTIGAQLVNEAGTTMQSISGQIVEIDRTVEYIAAASAAQSTAIDQLNIAISKFEQDTQRNAAMVEQTTAAASSSLDKTDELAQMIGQFRFAEEGAAPGFRRRRYATQGSAALRDDD